MEYKNNALLLVMEGSEDVEVARMEHVKALEFILSRNESVPLNWLFLDSSPHNRIFNQFGVEAEASLGIINGEDPMLTINKALRDQDKSEINIAYVTSGHNSPRVKYIADELLGDFEVSIKNLKER